MARQFGRAALTALLFAVLMMLVAASNWKTLPLHPRSRLSSQPKAMNLHRPKSIGILVRRRVNGSTGLVWI